MGKADDWLHGYFPIIKAGVAGSIVLTHLLFNLSLALLFLPLLPLGVWFISKLVPEDKRLQIFGPKYLDVQSLNTPPLAFAQAKQEILRVFFQRPGSQEFLLLRFMLFQRNRFQKKRLRERPLQQAVL